MSWVAGGPVDLDRIGSLKGSKPAAKAWKTWCAWMAKQGIEVPEARLWLVETEIA